MKKTYVLGVAVLLAGLMALSGVAQSAMWVGAELGGNFNTYPSLSVDAPGFSSSRSTEIRPSVLGGLTVGYDFVPYGFAGYNYPVWMSCFSFAVDFTYNKMDIQDNGPGIGRYFPGNSRLNGNEKVLTFLFMFHHGFFPDSEVPTGRVNPYIGIGPAIVWTHVQGSWPIPKQPGFGNGNWGDDATNIALVVEPGVRFMAMKNVSIDVAMRYRYSAPSWSGNNVTVSANALHQFAPLVRANYHF
jgi:opacity protein-like surface antigen